jgi:thiamine pyrophosphate-dependent acetolactate synthase large subunit-like protein
MIKRFDLLKKLAEMIKDEIVLGYSFGATGYEWGYLTKRRDNCISFGGMQNSTAIGFGLALALPNRKIVKMDADGGLLMGLDVLPMLGNNSARVPNLIIVVLDNEAYESVGWGEKGPYPTETKKGTDLARIAKACGIKNSVTVRSLDEFEKKFREALDNNILSFIVVKTEHQTVQVPKTEVVERGISSLPLAKLIRHIEKTEEVQILRLSAGRKYLFDKEN